MERKTCTYLTTVGYSSELKSITVANDAEEKPLPMTATTVLITNISERRYLRGQKNKFFVGEIYIILKRLF